MAVFCMRLVERLKPEGLEADGEAGSWGKKPACGVTSSEIY